MSPARGDSGLPAGVSLPLRRIEERDHPVLGRLDRSRWPGTLAPVRRLLEGFDLDPLTILVGENGAGKSTIVEAIAQAWGFPVEGGDVYQQRDPGEGDSALAPHLQLHRGAMRAQSGFFLRAETMHALAVHLDVGGYSGRGRRWLSSSHGESFMAMLADADRDPGLWILDEPESALSFQGQLGLVALLSRRVAEGSQVLLSTHSPILASIPGAVLWEVGEDGLTRTSWDDLGVVAHWRAFLDDPQRYHRHLADEG